VAVDVEGSGGRSKEKSPVKCVTAVRSRRRLVQQLHAVAIAASGLTARLPNLAPHNKSSLYTHNINLFAGKHFLQNAIEKTKVANMLHGQKIQSHQNNLDKNLR